MVSKRYLLCPHCMFHYPFHLSFFIKVVVLRMVVIMMGGLKDVGDHGGGPKDVGV